MAYSLSRGTDSDFVSSAESLFDYEPEKILLGTAEVGDYGVEVARAFLERFTPQNSLVVVTGPELGEEEIEKSSVSARDAEWQMEEVRLLSVRLYLPRHISIPTNFLSVLMLLCARSEVWGEISPNSSFRRASRGMEPSHGDRSSSPPPRPQRIHSRGFVVAVQRPRATDRQNKPMVQLFN